MKYVTRKPSESVVEVYLLENEDGVSIHVGDWAVAKIHESGMLRLAASIPDVNEEGLFVDKDGCIKIDIERF